MFKTIATLMRGQSAAAAEALADRHALLLLDQQLREAGSGLRTMQRALATATVQEATEAREQAAVLARIAVLEQRARAAMGAGEMALATEAAETIAGLEIDRDASATARTQFAAEIAQLRRDTDTAGHRLAALHRGRRTAHVAEAARVARQGRMEATPGDSNTLADAEATLTRLRTQQSHIAAANAALDEPARSIDDRLADAGFGPPNRPTAASVLSRLATQEPRP